MTIPDTRPADLTQPCEHPFAGCPCRQPGANVTLTYAIDVSNYQPADLGPLIAQHKPKHVVVRLSTETQNHVDIARQQLTSAVQAGCTVSGYVWCYFDLSPAEHTAHALSVADGFSVDRLWFDCEDACPPGQLDNWLSQAVALVEARGKQAGVYTSAGWWRAHGDSHGFTRLPLWLASYDDNPTLAGLDLPGGWAAAAGHQWSDTPIDRDVFDSAVIAAADPCQKLRGELEGMLAAKPYKSISKKRLAQLLT